MATWSSLTREEQTIYLTFENQLRAAMGSYQRLMNTFETLNTTYNAQISTIAAKLDAGTVVPTTSGLAGAASLARDTEMATLVSHMQSALTDANTVGHKNLRDKAAGVVNTLGSDLRGV